MRLVVLARPVVPVVKLVWVATVQRAVAALQVDLLTANKENIMGLLGGPLSMNPNMRMNPFQTNPLGRPVANAVMAPEFPSVPVPSYRPFPSGGGMGGGVGENSKDGSGGVPGGGPPYLSSPYPQMPPPGLSGTMGGVGYGPGGLGTAYLGMNRPRR